MDLTKHRVLLVEDEPGLAGILAIGLSREGFALETVHEGRSALTAVRKERFDLVILDLGLPDIEGFEILKLLKKDHQTASIPVIVFTGWQGTGEKLRAFDLGAVDYVTKPFELAELRARVRSVLRSKRLQDELLLANQELEAARAQAQEIARVKTEFLAKMSHEIRSPMNGVVAMTGLLGRTCLSSEQREYVDTIRTSGEAVLAIINDILNFSKIERGQMELETQPFDLRPCIEEAFDLVALNAAEKGVDLVCDIESEPPSQLIGDATRVRQVLINLVSNAVKFTAAGEVVVHVEARPLPPEAKPAKPVDGAADGPPWELHLAVRDTGVGIPASQLHRLFQTFAQADSSVTRRFGGTGLGLAISKGLVELMGGKLWAESVEGKGSTFHVQLPFPLSVHPEPNPIDSPQPQLAGRRVVVVDDNEACRRALVRQLTRWGLETHAVPGAAEIFALLSAGRVFDLALIDLRLGATDGSNLPAQLRSVTQQHPRCVLLTPFGTASETLKQRVNGSAAWLNKPVKMDQLYETLLRVLATDAAAGSALLQKQEAARPEAAPTLAEVLPSRILLADDNAINQRVGVRLLQRLGYQPDVVSNGLEAMAAHQRQPYDLILMDVSMPQMDGLEAARHIREFETKAALPRSVIVALTASAMPGDREACLAAGMDEYLTKPMPAQLLETTIKRFADRFRPGLVEEALPAADPHGPGLPSSRDDITAATTSSYPAGASPQGPASGLEGVLDLDRLRESAGGSLEQIQELVALYLAQAEQQLREIEGALRTEEAPVVGRVAHNCAGASGICGAVMLVPLLRWVEHAAKQNRLAEAREAFSEVVREFGRARAAFRQIECREDCLETA